MTNRVNRHPVLVGLMGALAFAIAACGTSRGGPDPTEAQVFVERLRADPSYIDEIGTQFDVRYEDEIRLCMAAQGFDYEPPEQQPGPSFVAIEDRDEAYYHQFGLGISTTAFHKSVVGDDLVGSETSGIGADDLLQDASIDHGADSVDAAFLRALEGDDENGEGGCSGQAHERALAAHPEVALVFELESADLSGIDTTQVDEFIRTCLRTAGFDYWSLQDVYGEMNAELESIANENLATEGEVLVLDETGQGRLRQLQQRETDVAGALWLCGWFPGNESPEVRQMTEERDRQIADLLVKEE